MKTEDLINVLSTNVEPVDPRRTGRDLAKAIIVGVVLSVGGVISWSGMRHDLGDGHALAFLVAKIMLSGGLVFAGARYLMRLGRPGADAQVLRGQLGWPAYVVGALAIAVLVALPLSHWHHLGMDSDGWLECLISIPVIAVVPFASVIWALRKMAPTNLPRTGAVAGIVAGGISDIGYALHCTDDSVSFIALWYGGAIALCALAGFLFGPRLLRW